MNRCELRDLFEQITGRPEKLVPIPDAAFRGKTVLVTGGGGFIGSAVCARLCEENASRVIAADWSDSALTELSRSSDEAIEPELVNVADPLSMASLFRRTTPDIVIHAAAYKHLPLLERLPKPAFRNNAVGTAALAEVAAQYGAERFVLVSTDKAVSPVSVLGLSKQLAEWSVLTQPPSRTSFAALRCGNVFGSTGSVVAVFLDRISKGKSLTVAHPDAERLFYTVQEITSYLLALAASRAPGLFAPHPPAPLRIADLARRLLERAGQNGAIGLEWTALGSGERIRESLWAADETASQSELTDLIRIRSPLPARDELEKILNSAEREEC